MGGIYQLVVIATIFEGFLVRLDILVKYFFRAGEFRQSFIYTEGNILQYKGWVVTLFIDIKEFIVGFEIWHEGVS